MTKILGLDLGTNSVGWAIVDEKNNLFSLEDRGVRIFSEGVKKENGVESSKAAERTSYRSARRINFRRKLRKYETLLVLSKNKMCPLSVEEVVAWRKSNFKNYPLNPLFLEWLRTDEKRNVNPYFYRDKASKQKVTPLELGRAFYHIAQRRGFLSNRLDQSADGVIEQHIPNIENIIEGTNSIDELLTEINAYFSDLEILDKKSKELDEGEKKLKTLYKALIDRIKANSSDLEKAKKETVDKLNRKENLGIVKQKISEISQAMNEGGFQTLGQYFFSLYSKDKIRTRYTAREEHYLSEFEFICKKQGIQFIHDEERLPKNRYTGLAKELYKAIFYQRPLKSQKGLIGKCVFENRKSRCSISHPDFEEYRMWAFLNTIKIKTPEDNNLRFLTMVEKQKIIPRFFRKSKEQFYFEELANELIIKGLGFEYYKSVNKDSASYLFNYKAKDTVVGCPVSASFKNIFGDDWKTKTFTYQTVNKFEKMQTRQVDYKDIWHLLSVSTSNIYLEEYAKTKLGLDKKRALSFSKIKLKKDFAKLSLNAITKILPYLKQGLLYSHAVFMANMQNVVDSHIWNNPEERLRVQNKINDIIKNNRLENSLVIAANGLINDCKLNYYYYSKEAEPLFKKDLSKKLDAVFNRFKVKDKKQEIVEELFSVFVEHLKEHKFIPVKRLETKVIEFLKGENESGEVFCSDEKRLNKLYHPSDVEVFKKKILIDEMGNERLVLGSPIISSIKNPMAMRALHQLRKVLNTLILEGKINSATQVHIELARELNDSNRRKAIQDFQNENKEKRKIYTKEIKELYYAETNKEIEPTEDDLLRYQLWIEQNRCEIYEEGHSISISDIIGSNPKYDIEHTIPRSLSQDNSLMNKTLCSKGFNREIKKQRLPVELENYTEILVRVDHWRQEANRLSLEIDQITKSIRATATKEAKDKKIRRRHYLTLKRNYIKGKYDRFIWREPRAGFKNSQLPDTGIITKYARAYLKSYFNRVEVVKGGMVSEFRKIWGLQAGYRKNGNKYYEPKDRSKHTHHTIDAITMACMTKNKYNVLAHAWALEDDPEKENYALVKELLEKSKPWPTFTQDLKKLEEEILVSHHTPDNVKKQTKKIIRIRGKKQYVAEVEKDSNGKIILKRDQNNKIIYKVDERGNKIPRYQQGDTARGSLHQESLYGAIKNPHNQEEIQYVIRKDLYSIKATEVESIVDEAVKEKIKQAIINKILIIPSNAKQKNKLNQPVWMNKEKGVQIKKVRIVAKTVKNPLEIKNQAPLSLSKKEYKQKVYAQNDENYCMAIYEGQDKKGRIKRSNLLINMFDAGNYYKMSNDHKKYYPIAPEKDENGFPLKYILTKGQMVLMYDKSPDELFEMSENMRSERLFQITQLDVEASCIKLLHHIEAREKKDLTKAMGLKSGMKGGKNIGEVKKYPWIKVGVNSFDCLVEGYDFKVSPSSKIIML